MNRGRFEERRPRESLAFAVSVVLHVGLVAAVPGAPIAPPAGSPFEVSLVVGGTPGEPGPRDEAPPPPVAEPLPEAVVAEPVVPKPVVAPPEPAIVPEPEPVVPEPEIEAEAEPEPEPEIEVSEPVEAPALEESDDLAIEVVDVPPVVAPKPVPIARPTPARRRVEDRGILAALRRQREVRTLDASAAPDDRLASRDAPAPSGPEPATRRAREHAAVERSASGGSGEPTTPGSLADRVAPVRLAGSGGGGGGGPFTVAGAGAAGTGRTHSAIWNHTQRYLRGLRLAYNARLRHDPDLRGTLIVRFEIDGNGVVGGVELVGSELFDRTLERDVLDQIRGWRYPPEPAGAVVVTWPFSFLPPD